MPRVDEPLRVIRTFRSEIEADLARSALEAAGIDSMLQSDDCGGVAPNLRWMRGGALLVREEDAARAEEILGTPALPAEGERFPDE
jgi:hypothetical protein